MLFLYQATAGNLVKGESNPCWSQVVLVLSLPFCLHCILVARLILFPHPHWVRLMERRLNVKTSSIMIVLEGPKEITQTLGLALNSTELACVDLGN